MHRAFQTSLTFPFCPSQYSFFLSPLLHNERGDKITKDTAKITNLSRTMTKVKRDVKDPVWIGTTSIVNMPHPLLYTLTEALSLLTPTTEICTLDVAIFSIQGIFQTIYHHNYCNAHCHYHHRYHCHSPNCRCMSSCKDNEDPSSVVCTFTTDPLHTGGIELKQDVNKEFILGMDINQPILYMWSIH